MSKRLLSVSSYRAYRACPRRYYYAYVLRQRPIKQAQALRFGTILHQGLEAIWRGEPVVIPDDVDPYERAKAAALLDGYIAYWDYPEDVIAIEQRFRAPLINPATGRPSRTWELAGDIDAVIPKTIVEHKSSSDDISEGSPYWARLRIDMQISAYFVGARSLGHKDVESCMYDVIGKPGLKPLKATPVDKRKYTQPKYKKDVLVEPSRLYAGQRDRDETPEEYGERIRAAIARNPERYYQRGEVVRLDQEHIEAAYDLWLTAKNIQWSHRFDQWPRNTDACMQWGKPCAYFDVCTGVADINDFVLFQHKPLQETNDQNDTQSGPARATG